MGPWAHNTSVHRVICACSLYTHSYIHADEPATRIRATAHVGILNNPPDPPCPHNDHGTSAIRTQPGTTSESCRRAQVAARVALENVVNVGCWDYIQIGPCQHF